MHPKAIYFLWQNFGIYTQTAARRAAQHAFATFSASILVILLIKNASRPREGCFGMITRQARDGVVGLLQQARLTLLERKTAPNRVY